MALLPVGNDVRLLLSRLRPSALWGWKGGAPNDTDQVVWRDLTDREPTEQEYLDEQVLVDAEIATGQTTRAAQRTRSATTSGKAFTALTAAEKDSMIEELVARAGGIDRDGNVRDIDDWTD